MNRSRRSPALLAIAAAVAVLALIAGCGDSGSDEGSDPEALLQETFSDQANITSGVLDISVDASATGGGGGSLTGSLSGPFESTGDDALPKLGLDASLNVDAGEMQTSFDAGVTVTDDAAFVSFAGKDYAVDDQTFATFKDLYGQSASAQSQEGDQGSALLSQLGVDPASWLTDVTNEGVEEINGAETVHISGTADIGKIVEDAQALAQAGGGAAGVDPATIQELQGAVKTATVDVYTGVDDTLLRLLELNLELDDPSGSGSLSLAVSFGLSGVNQSQEFTVPENAAPLDELIPGGLGAIPSGIGGASGGGSGTTADPSALGTNQEYLDCLQKANGDGAAIDECGALLSP